MCDLFCQKLFLDIKTEIQCLVILSVKIMYFLPKTLSYYLFYHKQIIKNGLFKEIKGWSSWTMIDMHCLRLLGKALDNQQRPELKDANSFNI